MADFPNSPVVGQTYTLGNLVWTWNGTAWDAQWGTTPQYEDPVVTSFLLGGM